MFVPTENRSAGPDPAIIDQILIAAENLIRRNGWVNGSPVRLGRGECIGRAVAVATHEHPGTYFHQVQSHLLTVAESLTGKRYATLAEFNDDPERTVEDIWSVLKLGRLGAYYQLQMKTKFYAKAPALA